ncbi:Uu.00g059450.m01.CDS01 [Anthostomella pinea]|uniref:rRNA-processing protein EFG1 n=1 Tax=Anthostomella pinea TaxID=933095 RepID=A0AAI8VLH5_9PEZI|nr:Uu.00g059450.m01.CDS01 [Anthostomella pinea]
MSSKRKFSDFNADSSSKKEESRERIPGYHAPKSRKKSGSHKARANPKSLQWVKKRVRTIERKMRGGTENLPANVQNDMEKELAYHKQKLDEVADDKKRKSMIKKYHMVRFFERKKADRLAKQIGTQLEMATDEAEIKKLKADLHVAEIDSLYARYFPHRERYESLYPVSSLGLSVHGGEQPEDASTAAKALRTERPKLWGAIEKASKKGPQALSDIRERKLAVDSRSKAPKDRPSKHSFAVKANQLKEKTAFVSDPADPRQGKGKRKEESDSSDSSSDSDSDGFFEKE